ncbi:hypothetical protein L596_014456 [Steinernema carpocapsae]|uniref:Calpain catalytic domain-containing protein n=1 Tax=Steinernema carpocapsae TaxID=34508 RepID=A0A4U5NCW7_STECR|nr:hypothetical protein L596_014456 [Steinernema carpocapsae]
MCHSTCGKATFTNRLLIPNTSSSFVIGTTRFRRSLICRPSRSPMTVSVPTRRRFFAGQNYRKLRAECRKKKSLFVDVAFPPTNQSLFLDTQRNSDIVWRRPGEISDNPKLFVEGASPNDVAQGILGNCWFVSACSALTHNDAMLAKVIPEADDQEWGDDKLYSGIFRFCFWRFGEWIEVVVDDLLPTKNGKLLFARSKTPNEFWSALLEKAFAKLYGCYENLVGGQLADALQDVSAGIAETINVHKFLGFDAESTVTDPDGRLFQTLRNAFDNQALIVAAIAAKNKEDIEKSLDCGLVKGHAYAVTAVRYIDLDAKHRSYKFFSTVERQMMIRLQNPWGEKEWNGPWADDSPEWEQVGDVQKKEMGITVDEDGEFWMPWDEFVRYFTDISVCQIFNTSMFSLHKRFHESVFFGQWSANGVKSGAPQDRAGGCLNFSASFCCNPQYRFDIEKGDGGEVIIALTQKEVCEGSKIREPYVTIGMHVMKVENNRKHRIHQAINPIATSDYAGSRSVYLHLDNLEVGRYVLIPTTFAPKEQTQFMLRVFSPQHTYPKLLKRDAPTQGLLKCSQATNVTKIRIIDVKLAASRELYAYCVVRSEKEKSRTRTTEKTRDPIWNEEFVFHRKTQRQKYIIEVWEDRNMKDKLIGRSVLNGLIDNDRRTVELDLVANATKQKIGKTVVEISAYDDAMYL